MTEPSLCIILNAASGKRGTTGMPERVRAWAADHGATLLEAGTGGDLPRLCAQASRGGFSTIVAAGGDGTIGAVAETVAGTRARLGVLPMGTFNYFARAHGIPLDIDAALDVLTGGTDRDVPVAEVNGKLILNNASLGLYPAILREREAIYRRWGRSRIAAYWSVLSTVAGFRGSRRMRVTVDGRPSRVKSPMVFVAISAFQLDRFGLSGADHVQAGEMAVFVAPDCSRAQLALFALRLALRGLRDGRDFDLLTGREVTITPSDDRTRPRLVARDGERAAMDPPFRFRVRPEPLRLLVPKDAG